MKKQVKILGTLCIIMLIAGVYFYVNFWIPHSKLRNLGWLETATPKEQRELAHKILSYPFGNHHDAYLILIQHGNEASVPYLLNRLKHFSESDFVECTQSHCIEALKKITGKDFGHDYKQWYEELKNQ